MARSIVVDFQGESSSFAFRKVDRGKLYGTRKRVALDPSGAACERAALTEDGSLILRQGMLAQGYFDREGRWIPQKELVGLDASGEVLEQRSSTLGEAVALEGPVPVTDLLGVRTQSVYALEPEEVSEALRSRLLAGEIFRLPFVYRTSWDESFAWLVANMDGELYAILGSQTTPPARRSSRPRRCGRRRAVGRSRRR
ncbi:MAG: hypothetical protein AAFX50_22570, partial [Acidobacteriota bacterium]